MKNTLKTETERRLPLWDSLERKYRRKAKLARVAAVAANFVGLFGYVASLVILILNGGAEGVAMTTLAIASVLIMVLGRLAWEGSEAFRDLVVYTDAMRKSDLAVIQLWTDSDLTENETEGEVS